MMRISPKGGGRWTDEIAQIGNRLPMYQPFARNISTPENLFESWSGSYDPPLGAFKIRETTDTPLLAAGQFIPEGS